MIVSFSQIDQVKPGFLIKLNYDNLSINYNSKSIIGIVVGLKHVVQENYIWEPDKITEISIFALKKLWRGMMFSNREQNLMSSNSYALRFFTNDINLMSYNSLILR